MADSDKQPMTEDLLIEMFDGAPHGMAVLDESGKVFFCNSAMEELLGHKLAIGSSVADWAASVFSDDARRAEVLEMWASDAAADGETDREVLIVRDDGKERWCSFHNCRLADGRIAVHGKDITKRMRIRNALKGRSQQLHTSEEQLRESETRYQNIINSIHVGMHMYNLVDGDLIFAGSNPAADEILGVKHDQFIGRTLEDAFPGIIGSEVPDRYLECAASGKAWHAEQITYEDNQISGAFDVHAFQTGTDQMVATFQEITERKRAEAALMASEERYRTFAEGFNGIAFLADTDLRPIFVHGIVEELSGYTEEDFVSGRRSWVEMIHPDDAEHQLTVVKRILTEPGATSDEEYRICHKDGRVIWVHALAHCICDESGTPVKIEGTMVNITRRKAAEEELGRLAAAVQGAAESIIITDARGTIQYVNPWFEKMTGYERSEIVGQNTRVLGSGKHDKEFYAELWSTVSAGRTWRGHFVNKKKDGTLFEENAVISPVRDTSGEIVSYVAVKRDVTHERELEGQIRQSQKMAAIGQLAHRVAHDFTNVLVMILGNAQLARAKVAPGSEVIQFLDEVISAANRVSILTAELLAFAHPSPLVAKTLKIKAALRGIEEILIRTIGREVELTLDMDRGNCKVHIDASQIEQAIVHVVINACEAMQSGGKLTVFVGPTDLTPEEEMMLQMGVPEEDKCTCGFAVISITDNGLGMTREVSSRAFEPFFSTKKNRDNPGLGLSTVYSIVQQHNGYITIDSQPGAGTCVKMFLPTVDQTSETKQ